jgi:hypothetical protein
MESSHLWVCALHLIMPKQGSFWLRDLFYVCKTAANKTIGCLMTPAGHWSRQKILYNELWWLLKWEDVRGLESLAGEYPDRTGGKYIPSGWTGKHPKGEFGGLCSHVHISLDNYWVATPCLCFQPHLYRLFTNTHLKCVLCCFFCFLTFIQTASECITSLGTGVRDNCEPSCRCWKLNLGPVKE